MNKMPKSSIRGVANKGRITPRPVKSDPGMNKYQDTSRFLEDTCVSAYVALLFGFYALVLLLVTTPTEAHWFYADPILKIFPKAVTLWGIPVLSILLFFLWKSLKPIQPQAISSSLKFAFSGAATDIVVLLAIRLVVGEHLPTFVPPEESFKPGYLLGMSAGLAEELIIRLGLTPLIFVVLRKRLQFHWSALITIVITALSFALWHEVGSGAEAFVFQHFVTRFMIPGVIMGLAVFYISPVFLVALHCTAHIMIPLLFV